jgi:hypothetical protein
LPVAADEVLVTHPSFKALQNMVPRWVGVGDGSRAQVGLKIANFLVICLGRIEALLNLFDWSTIESLRNLIPRGSLAGRLMAIKSIVVRLVLVDSWKCKSRAGEVAGSKLGIDFVLGSAFVRGGGCKAAIIVIADSKAAWVDVCILGPSYFQIPKPFLEELLVSPLTIRQSIPVASDAELIVPAGGAADVARVVVARHVGLDDVVDFDGLRSVDDEVKEKSV